MSAGKVVEWRAGWSSSEFMAAVMKSGGLQPGAVVQLEYRHDPSCPKTNGGPCRCDPDVLATVTSPGVA